MRKQAAILFGLSVAALLLSGCVTSSSGPPANISQLPAARGFTLAEVGYYSAPSDCLLAVGGKVYNVTSFFGKHPGGDAALSFGCGKDATELFSQKHEGKPAASEMLPQYQIGILAS